MHAGRSRNDQVLAALRLYLRDAVEALVEDTRRVADALEALAAEQGGVELPGYTHMQQAMPSSVALWAGGFAAEMRDDADGLRHAHRRILKNPLGSAAGYGTPNLPLDREAHANATRVRRRSRAGDGRAALARQGRGRGALRGRAATQDLGRLAADLLLFYTREFGFVELPDAFTTGSSIMPQKRNPDVFELVRGARRRHRPACSRSSASPPSCHRATSATCSSSRRRCSARSTSATSRSTSWRRRSRSFNSGRTGSASIPTSTRRPMPTSSWRSRASRSARPTGGSAPGFDGGDRGEARQANSSARASLPAGVANVHARR